MGDWNLLGSILEEVHIHSTIVGKIWLTILFIFRMLILGAAAEDVWDDEQAEFVCNTDQPGCKAACYDRAFPISLIRFWVLQVIFVSAPSLVYMGHALYCIRSLEKERHRRRAQLKEELDEAELALGEHRRVERELRRLDEQRRVKKAPLRGPLLRTYVVHILTRSLVEVCFILGQYALYGLRLEPLYRCERPPCPNSVDCYVSRPAEKTVFMVFMIAIAGVSLFLNLLEISHLGLRKIKQTLYGGERGGPGGPGGGGEDDSPACRPGRRATSLPQLCVASNVSPRNGPLTQTFRVVPEPERAPPSHGGPGDRRPSRAPSALGGDARGPGRSEAPPPAATFRDPGEDGRRGSTGSEAPTPNPRKTSFMVRPPSASLSSVSRSTSPSLHTSEESDELGSLQGDMPMMPPAGGRRMSMSMFLDISSIMKK